MGRKMKVGIMTAIMVIFGVAALAFAGWGPGFGCGGCGGGPGWNCPRASGNCPYYGENQGRDGGPWADFTKGTEDLRQKLYEKEMALRSELAKENPDVQVASNLQREISGLEGDLSQKRLDFELKMRKENPDYKPCPGPGCGQGKGCGRGGGYCCR